MVVLVVYPSRRSVCFPATALQSTDCRRVERSRGCWRSGMGPKVVVCWRTMGLWWAGSLNPRPRAYFSSSTSSVVGGAGPGRHALLRSEGSVVAAQARTHSVYPASQPRCPSPLLFPTPLLAPTAHPSARVALLTPAAPSPPPPDHGGVIGAPVSGGDPARAGGAAEVDKTCSGVGAPAQLEGGC